MAQLNYNHLHYFWVVATVGSLAKAAERLHVTPQTISGQIRTLEARLGKALFRKSGRKLELTETGRIVRSYAEPMFALGLELRDVLKKGVRRRSSPLAVGVATSVPKLIAYRVLAPALDLTAGNRVVCREGSVEGLVADLVAGSIDVAVTDRPVASTSAVRVASHLVGQCGISIFCKKDFADHYRSRFPRSLDGAAFVLPGRSSPLRDALIAWFRSERINPSIVAEIESPDLINTICGTDAALFALPAALAVDVERANRVTAVGEPRIEQQFYTLSAEQSIEHELLAAIIDAARRSFRMAPSTGQPTHGSYALPGDRDAA